MQRSIRPEWLLQQADRLAYRDAGQGQPRNADLRRGVSSAYYALYHHITLRTALHLLPEGSDDQRHRLTRGFQHQAVRVVCEWIVGGKTPEKTRQNIIALRENLRLQEVAVDFLALYDNRTRADYDHAAGFSKAEALNLVDSARQAVKNIDVLGKDPDLQMFMVLITFRSQLR